MHRHFQSTRNPGPWTHKWHPIQCTLVVDDFGINTLENIIYNISHPFSMRSTKFPWTERDWDVSESRLIETTKERGAPFHARLCAYSIEVIPTYTSTQTTKSTIPTYTSKIWCKGAVCQTSRWFKKAQQTGQKIYSRSYQIVSILCKSHWKHNSNDTQCTSIQTITQKGFNQHNCHGQTII